MTDLEMTRLCAEAMGYKGWRSKHGYWNMTDPDGKNRVCCNGWAPYDAYNGEKLPEPTFADALYEFGYDPLHDDSQAMALLFMLIEAGVVTISAFGFKFRTDLNDISFIAHKMESLEVLRRAIVECVARMQKAKVTL